MAYEMTVDHLPDVLHVTRTGQDTLEAAKEYWTRIAEILKSGSQRRLLMEEHLTGTIPDLAIPSLGRVHEDA